MSPKSTETPKATRLGKPSSGPSEETRKLKKGSSSLLLAEKALELRLKTGLSQATFARKAGMGFITYQRLETATSETTLGTADLVAKAYKLTLADMLRK